MKNNITDERIVNESNRIYKICFYILCGGLFLDLIVKFNLYNFSQTGKETLHIFGFEALFLVAVFYVNIFMLAKKGIAFGAETLELDKFPRRRYSLIAAVISAILTAGLWGPRFVFGYWEYGVFNAVLFCGAVCLITFALAFSVFYISFYAAFRVAKMNAE